MISAVAELYDIHPQTLRMYEREGLLQPNRSEGNTRLYSASDLERLEFILTLTRDLGVNLAGVEVILNMRENMSRLQEEVGSLMTYVRDELLKNESKLKGRFEQALVRVERGPLMVLKRTTQITVRSPDEQTTGDVDKTSNL
ncbi:MAG TPA: helix-turn-helix transcriptional regulator [Acidobacteriota bacterium]|nr:MerR family transcriptional regulator [Acidobacteriota bacterium]MEC7900901.1 helix-turn-helix transcriptional regulator [Acidobacteriota bacterium]MEC8944224.1 helix-turn-helix transcriptional regulator [Acidobacteriota bacterium]HJO29255.1 helix-turn-helix transcriptional regulator [Acidobacteriota bacterium]